MTTARRWFVFSLSGLALVASAFYCWSSAQDPRLAAAKPMTKWEIRFLPEPPGDFQKAGSKPKNWPATAGNSRA